MDLIIDINTATKDVEKWLDHKRIGQRKRETYKASIESLVGAVCDGFLSLNDEFEWIHKLKFEIGESGQYKELAYKPRMDVEEIQTSLQGVKADDADGRLLSYVAALTGKGKGICKKLDSEDYSIAQAIAIFFL